MEITIESEKKIVFKEEFNCSPTTLYEYISEPYKMTLWLADNVHKTAQGFKLSIDLPLHTITNSATIIEAKKPTTFEFLWESEFVMDKSLVTISLVGEDPVNLVITEVGDFDTSRWNKAQEIHIKLWKKAIEKLNNLMT